MYQLCKKILYKSFIAIVSLQFVLCPIAYSSNYGQQQEVYSLNEIIVKLKGLFRLKPLDNLGFLSKDKNQISLDELILSKHDSFYILSSSDEDKADYAIKVNAKLGPEGDKLNIAIEILDKNLTDTLAKEYFSINSSKEDNTNLSNIKDKTKMVVNSIGYSLKNNPSYIRVLSGILGIVIIVGLALSMLVVVAGANEILSGGGKSAIIKTIKSTLRISIIGVILLTIAYISQKYILNYYSDDVDKS